MSLVLLAGAGLIQLADPEPARGALYRALALAAGGVTLLAVGFGASSAQRPNLRLGMVALIVPALLVAVPGVLVPVRLVAPLSAVYLVALATLLLGMGTLALATTEAWQVELSIPPGTPRALGLRKLVRFALVGSFVLVAGAAFLLPVASLAVAATFAGASLVVAGAALSAHSRVRRVREGLRTDVTLQRLGFWLALAAGAHLLALAVRFLGAAPGLRPTVGDLLVIAGPALTSLLLAAVTGVLYAWLRHRGRVLAGHVRDAPAPSFHPAPPVS